MNEQRNSNPVYWEFMIELNDRMSSSFFKLKNKYGDFPTVNKLIRKKLDALYANYDVEELLELNYYNYQEEELQMLLFDLSYQIYIGDIVYNSLKKMVLDFIAEASELSNYVQIVPLITSLSRVAIFFGNTLSLLDNEVAYKVLCKKVYQQINDSLILLENYAIYSNKHKDISNKLKLELLNLSSKVREAFYNSEN